MVSDVSVLLSSSLEDWVMCMVGILAVVFTRVNDCLDCMLMHLALSSAMPSEFPWKDELLCHPHFRSREVGNQVSPLLSGH